MESSRKPKSMSQSFVQKEPRGYGSSFQSPPIHTQARHPEPFAFKASMPNETTKEALLLPSNRTRLVSKNADRVDVRAAARSLGDL